MPPRFALHLPRHLFTTAARIGRAGVSLTTRKRIPQGIGAEAADTMTAASLSTDASSTTMAVPVPVTLASVVPSTEIITRPRLRRREVAKEALLLGLRGLAASTDAFPPIKSAVGGLLFFVDQVELASSNKTQVLEIYARIETIVSSLKRAIPEENVLSSAHEAALRALAGDILALCANLEDIARERKRFVKRYIYAKLHRARLQDVIQRLDNADAAFMRTMVSSAEATGAKVLKCLQERHSHDDMWGPGQPFFFR